MGNVITVNRSELNPDPNSSDIIPSKLKEIIETWAKEDYDAGLNYGQTDVNYVPIKRLLFKRACCTRRENIKIALPKCILGANNVITGIDTGYTPVLIKGLIDNINNNTLYRNTCNLTSETKISNDDYSQSDNYASKTGDASDVCNTLYVNLCANIRTDREKQLTDPREIAYSRYTAKSLKSEEDKYNVYADCNCLNSTLRNSKGSDSQGNSISTNKLVQTLDEKCSVAENKTYKSRIETLDSTLCINSITTSDTTIQQSDVNLSQSCNQQLPKIDVVATTPAPTSAVTIPTSTASVIKPAVNILTPANIAIFVSSIVATIIFMMVFLI